MTTYNFSALKGDTYDGATFTLVVNGSAVNLTGAVIKAQFKKDKVGLSVKTISDGSGITIVDAQNGVFKIDPFIPNMPAGNYYYDIQITIAGVTKTRVSGIMTIEQDVTT